jgi:hypothetical protein
LGDVTLPLGDWAALPWRQLADHERFLPPDRPAGAQRVTHDLFLSALGCGLWVAE